MPIQQHIVVLSAQNKECLVRRCEQMLQFLKQNNNSLLKDIVYTLQVGRDAMACRFATVVGSIDELIQGLEAYLVFATRNVVTSSIAPIFYENTGNNNLSLKTLLSGKTAETLLQLFLQENELGKIALYWVEGGDILWDELYKDKKVKRVSLPTYPFAKEKYWISSNQNTPIIMPQADKQTEEGNFIISCDGSQKENIENYISLFLSHELLLDAKEIKVNKNIQDYGVDSITMMRLISDLEEKFGIEVSIKEIIENPTIEKITSLLVKKNVFVAGENKEPIVEEIILTAPLTEAQKGLWLLQKLSPEMSAYNVPLAFHITEKLDMECFEKSCDWIIERYPIFKTTIKEENGILSQYIDKQKKISIVNEDISKLSEEEIERALKERTKKSFCLDSDLFLRVYFFSKSSEEHIVLFVIHHIIFDGISSIVFMKNFWQSYYNYKQKQHVGNISPETNYYDFVTWEQQMFSGNKGAKNLQYWKEKLKGDLPILSMPMDYPRTSEQGFRGEVYKIDIDDDLSQKLRVFSNTHKINPSVFFLAVFKMLLSRYTGENDILIGIPTIGRPKRQFEETIGYFINMTVVRSQIDEKDSLVSFLEKIQSNMIEALDHPYPFPKLVKELGVERGSALSPIFQVSYAYQNFIRGNNSDWDFANIKLYDSIFQEGEYEFGLEVFENKNHFDFHFKYNPDLFGIATIKQIAEHYLNFLKEIHSKSDLKVYKYNFLSKQEQQKLLYEWNDTECDFPQDKCIHELLEEQVEKTPDVIAVVCGREQLTYRELNEKANQLAHYLLKQGLKPGDYIAVIINRSQEMVISILAILKSSGVYIPLDPESPIERLTFILENAKPKIVITQKKYFSTLKNTNAKIFFVEDKNDIETTDNVVNKNVDANKPCYIIYTSGSTGLPKGSIVYHKNIISLFLSTQKSFNFSEKDTWSLFHSFAFDFSVWEMWGALLHGGKLIIVPHWISRSSSEFYSLLKKEQVTILNQTPSAFEQLSNVVDFDKTNLNVRLVIFGGEELIFQKLQKWQECFDNINFVNMYGITETTVHVSIHQINKEDLKSTKSIIGKAINLWSIYILDRFMSFVPIGVCGEIYVGGAGLAQGYINKPGLTAERFIPNLFSKKEGERLYKTGDLARYLPDGNIEFIGRKDHQVKIRGFRIELGEIEANLLEHKNVKETVVIVREDTAENKMIVAYIVVSDKENTNIEDLRNYLKNKLPEYMIPSAFVVLDKLPLTPNGKVDRKALPKPDFAIEKVVKAKTPVEEIIVNVWQKLLTLENVGVEDNFFHVGGHSLLATQLVSRLSKTLQKEISIRDVFLYPTIREMVAHLEKKNRTIEKFAIPKADRSQNLPLSFAQQRLWFLDKLEGANANYNMPGALKLIGKLDIAKLEKALQCIVMRHEVLRTHFIEVENGTVQVIHNDAFTLQVEKNTNLEEIHRQIEIETHRPFDLGKDMLLRAIVYKVTEEEWILFVNMHHIISDGWSIGIFMRELATLYNALQQKDTCELDTVLPALKIQYVDFALWQREWLQGKVLEEQLGYWQQQLANIPTMLDLPTDKPRPAIQKYNGDHIVFEIEPEVTIKLQQLCNEEGVTMFMCVYAAFACLLARYSNQEDIVIGTPIANRNIEETEELIGFFVNTLALRVNLANNPTFLELLKEVRTTTLEAYNYQDVPFEYLVDRLAPERNMSHSPIFQVMLAWQNFAENDLVLDDLEIEVVESSYKIAKFDMTLAVQENNGKLNGLLEYNTDLFLLETMQQFLAHFTNILSEIVENPQQKISTLEILSKQEQQKIVYTWNDTEFDFPQEKCIHELFEEQVERTPDAIAVVCGEEQLTYRELNGKANQLAHYLLKQGLKPGDYIAVIINRSQEMVISILAILKSSGVYIPLDPESPIERLTFILENAKPKIVITQKKYFSTLKNTNAKIFFVEDKNDIETTDNVVNKNVDANKPCYIIYTSGSTGLPKGSIVYHKNIISLFLSTQKSFNFSEKDTWSLFHSFAFDFSVWEMWGALLHGGKLIIVPHWISRSSSEFYSLLKKEQVTILNQTPSAFEQLSNVVDFDKTNLNVRLVIFGGEELIFQKLQKWQECFDNINFVNMYGITETTVHVSIHQINKEDLKSTKSIIGKAINLWSIYILDRFMSFVPIGVCGEIYVGGAGLAQGYINKPGLTAERFIPNLFSKKEGERLYKTGDLARYLPDGNIEFIGRKDHQVKVRGFRIELGEIEANLLEYKDIKEAVAIVREDTAENKMIVAYIVVSDKENTNIEDLRNYLKNKLPEYMIPSTFVVLDKLPLTPNGKVDRKALPKPDFAIEKLVKAKTPVEEIIVNVWQKLLTLENVGVEDNFFHVGGHSLLATQLVSRLSKTLQKEISIRDVFLYPTIREIAAHLEKKNRTIEKFAITKADRSQNFPLSFAQQRLWFLDKLEGASANYNMPGALKFIGKLNTAKLEKALQYIVMRHEVLRTHFIEVENGAVQVIHNDAFTLQVEENTNLEEIYRQIEIETHRPFDLGKDMLLRAIVYKVTEEEWILFVNMHHITSDGWSIGIFMRELATLYNALQQKDTCELDTVLPALKVQYADFALWQREWLQGNVLEQQLGYWQQQLANIPTMLDLPTDKPRPVIQTYNGDHIGFEIEPEITQKLQQLCNEEGVTMFMCVYAAFACLLARYSNQEDIVIGTPIANRNIEETEELIGFFVNTLVLRINLENNPTFLELLKKVRTTTLEAYNHQDVPFEYLVDRLAPERNMSHSPIFQVMLAWQNFAENDLVLDNLEIEVVESPYKIAKFDITLFMQEKNGQIQGSLEYNTDLFLPETMQQFLAHFKNILSQIVEKSQQRALALEILNKQEQQKIVYEWNNTECDFPQNKCIHELFEEQVDKTPDAIAVVCGEEQLTYRELNEKANQLAVYLLQEQKITTNEVVGVALEKTIDLAVSIIGILKAGAVYLPLDINYPESRQKYMVEVTQTKTIIIHSATKNIWGNVNLIKCKEIKKNHLQACFKKIDYNNKNIAYILFTSGSTGTPKGVEMPHKALVNLIHWHKQDTRLSQSSKTLGFAPISFDVSFQEMFSTWTTGGTIYFINDEKKRDFSEVLKFIEKSKIERIFLPYVALKQLLKQMSEEKKYCLCLKDIITAGEQLRIDQETKDTFRQIQAILHNHYGPTESHVITSYTLEQKIDNWESLPSIGKPIANSNMYILNNNLQSVPVGTMGEIYIGGAGLARGYINRPGLTAERFIPNPFSKKEGERLYKTGDLARYLPDGNIEFIGRKDHQVKVRGFRIELGEIEANLLEHKNVKETVVIVREDTAENKMIVAYIVVSDKENTNIEDLRNYLKNKLPEYMIPSAFVVLDKLPLTPNGKVDRKALPKPDFATKKVVKAKTPVEEIIVNVWQKLLTLENVGVEDNFFHVGGHSLLATQLVSRLSKTLQKEISIRDVFLYPTIREIAAHLEKKNRTIEKLAITKADRSQNLPLSFAQQRLCFLDKLEGANANYNMPGALKFIGKLDIAKLEKALQYIVMRHEVLRTHFVEVESGTVQVIHNDAFTLQIKENTSLEAIHCQIEIETHRPFDLSKDMLLRAIVYKVAEEEWILFVNMHHIISDGWSIGIFMRELTTLYNALQQKDTCELDTVLPALKIQYADFALWQREWLQGKVLEEQLGYWQQQLANIPTMLDLPTDKSRPAVQTYNGNHIGFEVEPEITQKLQQLCNEESVTMFMCVYAAFVCLLARYSNQEDIVIGTPIANRNIEETEELIGFFVNTLALRINLENNPTFLELLKEVRTTTLEAYNHQDVPFEYLVDRLAPERNMSHSPIFQVMLAWQNFAENDLVLDDLEIEVVESPYKIAKFDMTLAVQESNNRLIGSLEYNTDLFLLETMQQFIAHFKNILSEIVEKQQQKVSVLEILSKQEQQKIVYEWNNTECDFPQDKCIHELFEEQVDKTPDAVAVACGEEKLTYRELNQKSNQLAYYLVEQGAKGLKIGVIFEKSEKVVIYALSILKSGGIYIPIDPITPKERIHFIINDAKISFVMTNEKYLSLVPDHVKTVCFESSNLYPINNLNLKIMPKFLAYIIYTSGSTGMPKGVAVSHLSLINTIYTYSFFYQQKPVKELIVTSFAFDVSVRQIFSNILHGSTIHIAKEETLNSQDLLYSYIKSHKISLLDFSPSFFSIIRKKIEMAELLDLKYLILGAEALAWDIIDNIKDKIEVFNMYGPTECSVDTHIYHIKKKINSSFVPIGKVKDNSQSYLLDNNFLPVPIGVVGEIYIGGAGLARSYINRPGLTAERFVPHPFSKKEGERLYKTGDLARYLPDGNIEFIGRKDHQVKVRGFRIELGEIEANLLEHKNVKETVVIVREDTTENKMIVAYIVVSYKENTNIEYLRSYLKNKLPEYMIPSVFVVLDKLPLTPNGKVDRKALPKPDFAIEKVVKAKTPVEEIIVNVWQKLLALENIGVEENFFHVGGHSLLATQLVSRLSKTLQKEISIRDVFLYPTIREMAAHLEKKNRTIENFAITKADRSQNLPLSFAQQRLWFLDKLQGANANYNMPGALKFTGKFDIAKLEKALQCIVMRHEVLRTHFVEVENGAVQVIHNDVFTLQLEENTNLEEIHRQIEIETHRPFILSKDMLLRAIVYKVAEEWILFVNMHHIISDGWSIGIFMRELSALYNALQKDTCELNTVLPALKIQYADFALWQREWLQGKVLEQQLSYWQQQLANIPTMLDLPTDKPRPAIQTYNGDHIVFEIEPEITQKLQQLCNEEGVTMFMCVYAAFACLLARYSNQEDIVIGTPIANRNIEETEELIGFFVNTLVLRIDLANNSTFLELLKEVRTATLEACNHQDVPFEYLVDRLAPKRNMSHSPIFQVMLAWQNFAENDLVLNDLEIEFVESPYKIAKFDMTLAVQERDGRLSGSLEYNTDLFLLETMQQFLGHFKNILSEIVERPQQKISSLEILSKQEQQKIVYEWNDTECDFPQDKCIHELFEEQVEKTPDAIAVVCGEEQLTYRELNKKANQLAHYLVKQGTKGLNIGVIFEKSEKVIIYALSILKSGSAYIPIDPITPKERINFITRDAKISFVMTNKKYLSLVPNNIKTVCIENSNLYPITNLNLKITPKFLAYIIYTSGSTGMPKGVAISHLSLINTIHTYAFFYKQKPVKELIVTSFAFDVSVRQIFSNTLYGNTIHIAKKETLNNQDLLCSYIKNHKISLLNFSPSFFSIVRKKIEITELLDLKYLILGAETLSWNLIDKIKDKIEIFNMYGPTECSVDTHIYHIKKKLKSSFVPIGKIKNNSQSYLLDNKLLAVPVGVIGEIYIGGVGLAQGYINQPGLTAERFIPNPFSKKEGERLYKTGDIARYLPDGNIEFIGRKDHQVKVRGFRIELGEIEANLLEHKNVKETVVIVREDTTENKMIVAYIVVSDKENTNIEDLRNYLKNKLPEYMIPSAFVVLNKLPLTPNGKVDRKALPKPDFSSNEVMLPRNEVEAKLVGIWQDVLKLEKVSIQDNFFHIGGHSLLAVQLISKINRHFQIELPLQELFKNPVIAKLSQILQYNEKREWSPVISFPSLQQTSPFFCFPGMGGTVLYLYDFLQNVSDIQPCYGLQALGFDGSSQPHGSIEEMAEYYIYYMKQIQPCGPYVVGGHSLGGKIAFEVARQLYLQGDKITKLIIIDTTPEMDMGEDYDDAQLLCDVASLYEEFYGQDLRITKERLQNLTWQDKIVEVHTEFVKAGLLPNDKDTRYLENHLNIYRAQSKINYKPEKKKYPIPTILYRAQQNENIGETNVSWGWEEYVDDVQVVWVPGTHIAMMASENNKTMITDWRVKQEK